MSNVEKKPNCYGRWDHVFPMGSNGLRSVRPACNDCHLVQACLRVGAESPDGLEMRAGRLETMDASRGQGLIGFFHRWSELKSMKRKAAKKLSAGVKNRSGD